MAASTGLWAKIKRGARVVQLLSALVLVYATYNPTGMSYYHWAIQPWIQSFFGKAKVVAGPHSLKAFIGVTMLIGWFFFLRTTKRKIGSLGILLAVAFFLTLGWVLTDYGLFPNISGSVLEHAILLIISFILTLGMLLPDKTEKPKEKKAKEKKAKEKKAKEKGDAEPAAENAASPS